jgi:hypothetical protein
MLTNHAGQAIDPEDQLHVVGRWGLISEIMAARTVCVFLKETLRRAGWKTIPHSIAAAQRVLSKVPVVMFDEKLPDGNWKDVLTRVEPLPMNPVRHGCLNRPIRQIRLYEDTNDLRGARMPLAERSTSLPEEQE